MTFRRFSSVSLFVLPCIAIIVAIAAAEDSAAVSNAQPAAERLLPSQAEARVRAELLHDVFHAMLQEIHHSYFREDEKVAIPAVALKSVFGEIARHRKIELCWLAINAQAMNVDHQPKSEFEKEAAKAISAGAKHFERTEGGVYRRVGSIVLTSECLKCHLPLRSSNKNRLAGLLIAIPVKGD